MRLERTPEVVIAELREVGPWYHQVDLGNGLRTRDVFPAEGPQPVDHPLTRWEAVRDHIPADLSGMRVLDVGCADGFFTVEVARRGADEVVATDPWAKAIARVDFLKRHFDLPAIRARKATIYDLDPAVDGRFDLALMLAVLYHLEHPVLGLQKLATVTDRVLLESITVDDEEKSYLYLRHPHESASQFVPKWLPTKRCLVDMLRWVGFTQVEEVPSGYPSRSVYLVGK